jgi:ABC-type transport system involved in multi-copper enzyme maturation permease subunit
MSKRRQLEFDRLAWQVRDTFRQSMASRVLWVTLGVTALCVVLCLSMGVRGGQSLRVPGEAELFSADGQPLSGPNPHAGQLTLAFGGFRVSLFRDGEAMVRFLELMFTKWVAGAIGTALAIIWTAGFLPELLRPSTAALAFTKPLSRSSLLLAKILGVLVFVLVQAALFVGGTWLALGLKTGYWMTGYLWSIPLLTLHFAIIYSFSALLAVMTRSTVVCTFGSLVLWFLCFAVNYGRCALHELSRIAVGTASPSSGLSGAVEIAYQILPKPLDFALILDRMLQAEQHFHPAFPTLVLHPWLSLSSSLLFAAILLALAAREVESLEY